MAYVQVSRNGFARETLMRETVEAAGGCDWCGATRKSGKLFAYAVEYDAGRVGRIDGRFCCKSCMEAYHG